MMKYKVMPVIAATASVFVVLLAFQNCGQVAFTGAGSEIGEAELGSSFPTSPNQIESGNTTDPLQNDSLSGKLNGQEIVATIYSETDGVVNTCKTIHNSEDALAAGYFDDAKYSNCRQDGIPECINGSQKIVFAQARNGNKTKYHTVCVKSSETRGSRIVATIYSKSKNDDPTQNICLTARNADAAKMGYFDIGSYSFCGANNIPSCGNGSKKVIFSMSDEADGSIKYHTACVVNGSIKSKTVATIYSESENGKDSCLLADSPQAAQAGYFDLGQYSYCSNGVPLCKNGSRKVIHAITQDGLNRVKYHTACVVDSNDQGDVIVATIYSESKNGVNLCLGSDDSRAKSMGYFDLGNYSYCDANNTPQCRGGSKKIIMSDNQDAQGVTRYQTACIL